MNEAALCLDADDRPFVLHGLHASLGGLYLARRVTATDVASADAMPSAFGIRVSPHPVRTGATISFSAPADAPAVIRVYDVRGRLVETLRGDANAPSLFWEGRDAAGEPFPSGVYFLPASTPATEPRCAR